MCDAVSYSSINYPFKSTNADYITWEINSHSKAYRNNIKPSVIMETVKTKRG